MELGRRKNDNVHGKNIYFRNFQGEKISNCFRKKTVHSPNKTPAEAVYCNFDENNFEHNVYFFSRSKKTCN